jgi:hypothetical protein
LLSQLIAASCCKLLPVRCTLLLCITRLLAQLVHSRAPVGLQFQFLDHAKPVSDYMLAKKANESDGGNGGLGTNVVFVTHSGMCLACHVATVIAT